MANKTEPTYTVTLTENERAWVIFALGVVSVHNPEDKVPIPYILSIARKIAGATGALKCEGE